MKKIIAYLMCVGVLCANSDLEKASVTMPYVELANLLERVNQVELSLKEEPATSPVAVLVNSAEYSLDATDPKDPKLEAHFVMSNLSEEWQTVPLLEDSTVVTSVEPKAVRVVVKGGSLCALLEPQSEVDLKMGIMLNESMASRGAQGLAKFSAVEATRSVLKLQHSYDPSLIKVEGAVASNASKTEFGLPASGGAVSVKLYESKTLAPAQWRGREHSLLRFEKGGLLVESHLSLMAIDNGRTSEVVLRLPAMVDLRSISSLGVKVPYRIEMSERGAVVYVSWESAEEMQRELRVTYRLPLPGDDALWSISGIEVDTVVGWSKSYYVLPLEGFSLAPKDGQWGQSVYVPEWIAAEAGVRELYHFVDSESKGLQIIAKSLPRLKTAGATIALAEYSTDVVAEGGTLYRAGVLIEHMDTTRYAFSLPKGSKLLSCQLNGRSAEPLLMESGALSLILNKTPEKKTRVSYVYTSKGDELEAVEGAVRLELPRTPLFINEVKWFVQLPKVYQATAIEGNVVIDGTAPQSGGVRLSKKICDDEAPFARLYYTRKDLDR